MKKENQNTEFKESWRDEHLKPICGFANAEGGRIYIGINDNGKVTGINDSKKLLEDIPNKVRDILGIMVTVNLEQEDNNKEYLEIIIDQYPYPINYKGQYFIRSGSTNQELKGQALNNFLLQRLGKHWDGVPLPDIKPAELSSVAFNSFREKAKESNRLGTDVLSESNNQLLDSLSLKDGKNLKRAAVLLFHPRPHKYVQGAYIKIGFFEDDDDLKFQDEIYGSLFEQIEKTSELLFTKYFKAIISYKGINRVENYDYPRDTIREALLNAIAHKNYSEGVPVQIRVYEDKVSFWNTGQLPDTWTIDHLKRTHATKPFNPAIADVLFKSGYIESWGRGTLKILKECKENGLPEPSFEFDAANFIVEIKKDIYTKEMLEKRNLEPHLVEILLYAKKHGSINNSIVQDINNVSKRTATRYLGLLEGSYLEKSGETGKGTEYILKGPQRGQNNIKGAKRVKSDTPKNNTTKRKPKTYTQKKENKKNIMEDPGFDELDSKILAFSGKLGKVNKDDIRTEFDADVFFKVFDGWLSKLFSKIIPTGQKFNTFFRKTDHHIFVFDGVGQVKFSTEPYKKIIDHLRKDCLSNINRLRNDTHLDLRFTYHHFKKGGTKTFSCVTDLTLRFSQLEYELSIDRFSGKTMHKQTVFKRLLHKPVTDDEINNLVKNFGNDVLKKIETTAVEKGIIEAEPSKIIIPAYSIDYTK